MRKGERELPSESVLADDKVRVGTVAEPNGVLA
jgi:hypothetical protein